MAAELDARKAELAQPIEQAEALADGGEPMAEMTPEAAMRQLEEDFGPEFVSMIVAIAGKSASEVADGKVSEIGATLQDVIGDIKDSRARRHFKEIYRAHPDFSDVGSSDEFTAWIEALPPDQKAEAQRVVASGDADEIVDLLTQYKRGNGGGDPAADEQQIDDAEGVRSTGLRLPDAPEGGKDDFAAAWDEHA